MPLRVLMLGWELPPFNTGGLGEACLGLATALSKKGASLTFVLPKRQDFKIDSFKVIFADVDEILGNLASAYMTFGSWSSFFPTENFPKPQDYLKGAFAFAEKISLIAKRLEGDIDIIHAHDWMTFPAAIAAKNILGKPLVVHVHSTEFDRTGGNNPNQLVYEIEKKGFEAADKIIPVGGFMKNVLTEKYGISPDKIKVVYNGIDAVHKDLPPALNKLKELGYKVVLYLGRITLQKGPEYFVRAAKIVSSLNPKVIFVVTGSGDMQEFMVAEAGRLGVLDKFMFTGFLRGDEKDSIYQSADLYVMPSVSEPFGITALEAVVNGTPVLVSKQSGVAEILKNALKVDFWDVEEMANKIIAVLQFNALKTDLRQESSKEVKNFSWQRSADQVLDVYSQLI